MAATRGTPLHTRIFIGMALGIGLGLLARTLAGAEAPWLQALVQQVAIPMGQIFLRLVFMVVIPMVIAALALGVCEIGDVGKVGRIGLKTLFMTLLFSGIAVLVGVFAVNVFQPGVGLNEADRQALMATLQTSDAQTPVAQAAKAKPAMQSLVELIPSNPFANAVNAFEGGLLPLMVFALLLGVALAAVGENAARPLKDLLESIYAVALKIIDFAMQLAPFGVAGLMFTVGATLGVGALKMLAQYALVVVGALAFHQIVVYGLGIRLLARRNPWHYFKALRSVMLTAFATSSSAVTLPSALTTATENLKLPRSVSHFVLTVGATANQNGTALYEGITVLFLAQMFGIDLSITQQLTVVMLSIAAGIGTAGVPGGSLPMIVIVLGTVGVPGAAVGIIMGVDRILDMCRTVLNVTGDLTIATCVAATEPPETKPAPTQEVA